MSSVYYVRFESCDGANPWLKPCCRDQSDGIRAVPGAEDGNDATRYE